MERIFPELTAECEKTAIMYCSRLEKKEIADINVEQRVLSLIN